MWVLLVVCLYVLAVQHTVNLLNPVSMFMTAGTGSPPPNPELDNEKKIDGCMVELF